MIILHFHFYFINVELSLAKKFNGSSANFVNHLRSIYMNSMFLNEITINEVAKEMTKLNPKKGFGVDGLSPKVVQCIANYITEPLTHTLNLSFSTCKIPHELKFSLVTPVYKADDNK